MVVGQCLDKYLLAVSTTSELRKWGGVLPCMVRSLESPGAIVTFEGGAKEIDFDLILNRLFLKFRVPSSSESVLVPKIKSMPIKLSTTSAAISNLWPWIYNWNLMAVSEIKCCPFPNRNLTGFTLLVVLFER